MVGSAGGFEGVRRLLAGMRRDCSWAVTVGLHAGPLSHLADALRVSSPLPVVTAASGDVLAAGRVFLPPAGTHLVINPDGRVTISTPLRRVPFRPSADWLLESAAASYGERHVAIVLSGMLTDGASRVPFVTRMGGTVLVQDPAECRHAAMPRAAAATGAARVLPLAAMNDAIQSAFAARDAQADYALWEAPFRSACPAR